MAHVVVLEQVDARVDPGVGVERLPLHPDGERADEDDERPERRRAPRRESNACADSREDHDGSPGRLPHAVRMRSRTVRASTRAPSSQCSGAVNSSGVWLIPSRLGTKSIAEGTCRPSTMASCPAPLGMRRCWRPRRRAASLERVRRAQGRARPGLAVGLASSSSSPPRRRPARGARARTPRARAKPSGGRRADVDRELGRRPGRR